MSKIPLDEQVKMIWDELIKIWDHIKKLEEEAKQRRRT